MTDSERGKSAALNGTNRRYKDPSEWANILPHCIYFYYVKPSTTKGQDDDIRVYVIETPRNSPINETELKNKIKLLTKNARDNGSSPPPCGWSFTDVVWRRISWIVVALDSQDGYIAGDAVDISWYDQGQDKPNHNFFDGGDGVLAVPGGGDINAVWTRNHMRDEKGKLLGKKMWQSFKFHFKSRGRPFVDYPDETGNNMGPPIGPP